MLIQLIFLQLFIIVLSSSSLDNNDCDKSSSLVIQMRKGNWKCAKDIVISNSDKALDHKSFFEVEERIIMKEIAMLKQLIDTYQPANYINPAFQWAQSPSEILLNVKFAHKLDAPATLNVEANNVTITENSIILLASNGRKNFKLELSFLKNIIPSESTYAMASVGRMTITLKKEHNLKWTRLTSGTQKLKHMHVWWDVVERYKKDIEKLPEIYKPPPPIEETESKDISTESSVSNNDNNTTTTSTENNSNDNNINTEINSTNKTEISEENSKKIPEKTKEELANEKYDQEISKLNAELKSQMQQLEEEIRKRKKEIDLKAREEKTKLDTELTERKKSITSTIHHQKQSIDINSGSSSITSEL